MIKNDRQYRITKAAAVKFEDALQQLASQAAHPHEAEVHPLIATAHREALRSQLDELRAQLREYEELVRGERGVIDLGSLKDLPQALVQARISSGLNQKDLAAKLGLKEQQIQRYEATDYQHASLSRLLQVADAVNLKIRKELFLSTRKRDAAEIFARLRDLGFWEAFVLKRLVKAEVAADLSTGSQETFDRLVFEVTRAVAHIFGWTPSAVIGSERPWLDKGVLGAARFKLRETVEGKSLAVYTFYAHFLALLLLRATEGLPCKTVPTDPDEARRTILERYGSLSFRSTLLYCWDLGIPVLPLTDPGAFHAACWRVSGRNVVVLKQRTSSLARWLFDLLHELRHSGEEPGALTHEVVETPETAPERLTSEEEKAASWFAGDVVLGGHAEELVKRCEHLAQGRIERLKMVVQNVAIEANVDVASLANYLAFRF